jgi:pimeloyl-ACP methyl ester carboxylesterase
MRGEFVDVGGARLYYYAAGTRGAGEPVLLLHGCLTSSHLWSSVVPCLPPGHRTVVVDLLGHCRSDPPGGLPVSASAHAARAVRLLDALGIARAGLVGHGLGGAVAQLIAGLHPARVSKLCVVDAPPAGRPATTLLRVTPHLPLPMLLSTVRSRLARGYVDSARAARSLEHYLRPFLAPGGRDTLAGHLTALAAEDTTVPGTISAPTAIIAGAHDPFVSLDDVQALRGAIPGATLEVLADSRHYAPEESPERVAAVITELLSR